MKMLIVKQKHLVFILVIALTILGIQESYGQTITASTAQPLTEANLHGSVVKLTLSGSTYAPTGSLNVTGIAGVGFINAYLENKTVLRFELTFSGNIDTDTNLVFTVGANAIPDYNGEALTAQLPVTAVAESLVATTETPLTEVTLNDSIVTLTLSGRHFASREAIQNALSFSGIKNVVETFENLREEWWFVVRESDTVVTLFIPFSGNIDADTILTITLGPGAIANYLGPDFAVQLPVTANDESLDASTGAPLTEADLQGGIITLTLSGRRFIDREWDIENALTISGIEGAAVSEYFGVHRISDTEVIIRLTFNSDIDTDATLTLTVGGNAFNYNKDFTFNFPVTAVEESLDASTEFPLTEANLNGSIITLTLTGRQFANSWTIEDSLTLSGIEGVTVSESYDGVRRISDTEVKVRLTFNGDFDADTTLTLTVGRGAINYNKDFTFNFHVTAVEESLDASTEFPLTEVNLNGNIITLTLTGRQFANRWTIEDSLSFSGIEGATVSESYESVRRVSDTVAKVKLTFNGDFDTDGTLTLTVGADAINYNKDFTFNFPVTAIQQSDATVSISPSPIALPGIGKKLSLNMDIANGKNVVGYQATVVYDPTVLDYVESANGNYLAAEAFFVKPIRNFALLEDPFSDGLLFLYSVTIAGYTLAEASNGDGTLATLTFEVNDHQPTAVTLSDVYLVDATGKRWEVTTENGEVVEPPDENGEVIEPPDENGEVIEPPELVERIFGDLNLDGAVNIQDLVIVSNQFGWRGKNIADVSGDGLVNIVDLVLVAAAFGDGVAAPTLHSEALEMFTAADVQHWLSQAKHLNLTDATSQKGILFFEQLLAALMPKKTALLANYPNPFNPETWIPYHLAKDADVTLTIYAMNGHIVRTLTLGHQHAGMYQSRSRAAYWDGKNAFGEPVASGVYFYTLTAGDFTATRKMLIRK